MPSTKKRINLTVPDSLYQRLQQYKEQNGMSCDATACLQLITKQLNSEEEIAFFKKIFGSISPQDFQTIMAAQAQKIQEKQKTIWDE